MEARAMGLGELGNPQLTFVRKFRWTLNSLTLQEHFVKKVDFDFAEQVIYLEIMEVIRPEDNDINVHQWLESDLSKDTLVFTTLDSCGVPIYQYEISRLTLLGDKSFFDYSLSDESCRSVKLHYDHLSRTFFGKNKKTNIVKKGFTWKMKVEGGSNVYDIKMINRPSLNIEETEINFLNSKTWIAGKAEWNDLEFTILRQHDMILVERLLKNKESINLEFYLYDMSGENKIETWFINGCHLNSVSSKNNEFKVKISYKDLNYKSH